MTLRIRHLAHINPSTPAFDALPPSAELTFMPLETVWADGRLDTSRVATKVDVSSGYVRFQNSDVLVPKTAPTFQHARATVVTGLTNGLGAGSSELHLLRPRPGSDPRFLAYVARSSTFVEQGVTSYQGVAGLQRVPADFLADWPVASFAGEEQRRIGDFLDDQVGRLNRAVALGQRHADLLDEELANLVSATVTGAFAPRTRVAMFSPLGLIPTHWTEARLRSIRSDVQTGPFGSQLHAQEYVRDGWPIVNPANIKNGAIIADPNITVSNQTRDRLGRHILQRGDVVFGRRGELGRSALVTDATAGWVCGTGSLRIRFADADFDSAYLSEFLQLPAVKYYFLSTSVGSTMDNLNTSILLNMPLLIPPRSEQREIANQVASLRDERSRLTTLARRRQVLLHERKQALITAAVTGQFDVTAARAVA